MVAAAVNNRIIHMGWYEDIDLYMHVYGYPINIVVEKILASDHINDVCVPIKKWVGIAIEEDNKVELERSGVFVCSGEVSSGIKLLQTIRDIQLT